MTEHTQAKKEEFYIHSTPPGSTHSSRSLPEINFSKYLNYIITTRKPFDLVLRQTTSFHDVECVCWPHPLPRGGDPIVPNYVTTVVSKFETLSKKFYNMPDYSQTIESIGRPALSNSNSLVV